MISNSITLEEKQTRKGDMSNSKVGLRKREPEDDHMSGLGQCETSEGRANRPVHLTLPRSTIMRPQVTHNPGSHSACSPRMPECLQRSPRPLKVAHLFAVHPSEAFVQPHCTSSMGHFSSFGGHFSETYPNVFLLLIFLYTDILKAQLVLFSCVCASF